MKHLSITSTFAACAFAAVVLGCSSATQSADGSGAACELTAADSTYLSGGAVYRACGVDTPARLRDRDMPLIGYRPPETRPPREGVSCFFAEVEFVVDANGKVEPGTARIIRHDQSELQQAVLSSVATWRYEPARKGGMPVRQIVKERRIMATAIVAVRSGSGRPTPPPPPNCR